MKFVTSALVALAMAAPGAASAGAIADGQGWTGFYVGGHLGGLRADYKGVFDPFDDSPQYFSDLDQWGFAAGGQIGYDYQAPGMGGIVVGVVLDASYASNDSSDVDIEDDLIGVKINYLASARMRAGYPVADIMPYVTIGAAYADFEGSLRVEDVGGKAGDSDWGYVAGFGMDWAVSPSVTVGAEALVYDFDYVVNLGDTELPGVDSGDWSGLDRMWQFRLTANYRF